MGKKQVITEENNKILVTQDIEIQLTPGEYTFENLLKEIQIQARKKYPKAVVSCTGKGAILIDLIGDQHG